MEVPVNGWGDFNNFKLAADKLSAEATIFWEGRNLTVHQKYSKETTPEQAKESIEKTLPKMLLLADIYGLGVKEKAEPTTKITLKGSEVTRLRGKKEPKIYEIEKHLRGKRDRNKSKNMEKIALAIEHFSPTTKTASPLEGKVTKELNEKQQSTAKKVMKAALAGLAGLFVIAIAPVLLLTAGAYALGKYLVDHVRVSNDPKVTHLVTASKEMKNSEEAQKLEAAMTFYSDPKNEITIENVLQVDAVSYQQKIETPETHRKLIERTILRELAKDKPIRPEEMKDMITKVHESVSRIQKNVQNSNIEDPVDTKAKEVINRPKSIVNARTAAVGFKKCLDEFLAELKKVHTDTRQGNESIIKKFRELLECEGYQALKHDQSIAAINLIHRFAASIWTEVKMMEPYREFGQKALARADELYKLKPNEMRGALDASIKSVDNDLFQVRRLPELIMYTVTHPLQTIYSIVSEHGWYSKAISGLVGGYDPHGNLSNNPSLQGKTTMSMSSGKQAFIDSVYGGSPTIDGKNLVVKIAPEFLAVVQAAENNQIDIGNRIPGIPDKVFYTNFQDLSREGENSRSVQIMELNKAFPFSFVGITLSKDSDFYKMKEGEVKWEGAEEMKNEMFGYLMSDKSFTLENRAKKEETDKGFYFPGDKQKWEPILKPVLANAVKMFSDKEATNDAEQAKKYRGAFQEYVYASLQFYLEMQVLQELILQGIDEPHLHSQRACKENIDRGGAANAAYLYLRLGLGKLNDMTDAQKQQLVVGALHCRALGARDRAILSDRLPQVLDFIEQVTPEKFWELQKNLPIFNDIQQIQQLDFTPALAV